MKRIYIIVAVLMIAGIAILVKASDDMSTYANFEQASELGRTVKIVGQLARDMQMNYDPETDPNHFRFHMRDNDGEVRQVILTKPKPQDFELSEQIVLTGKMEGDQFVASEILMKCPSKYKDEELELRGM